MRVIRSIQPAVYACAMALVIAPALAAQEDSSARPELRKIPEQGPSAAKQTEKKEVKEAMSSDSQALGRAHAATIRQATALQQIAAQPGEPMDKGLVAQKTQMIGESLESAREHLNALEAVAPQDEKTRERIEDIREEHESAMEHYRELLQRTNSAALDTEVTRAIAAEASDIVDDLTEAEEERMKLPGAKPAQSAKAPASY